MTNRERYLKVTRFEQVDGGFAIGCCSGWPETLERWKKEGWDGRRLHEIFGLGTMMEVPINYGPAPLFEQKTIEEDD